MNESTYATASAAEPSPPPVGPLFRSLEERTPQDAAKIAMRLENLQRTHDLVPQCLNSRLLLALRVQLLRQELSGGVADARDAASPVEN